MYVCVVACLCVCVYVCVRACVCVCTVPTWRRIPAFRLILIVPLGLFLQPFRHTLQRRRTPLWMLIFTLIPIGTFPPIRTRRLFILISRALTQKHV